MKANIYLLVRTLLGLLLVFGAGTGHVKTLQTGSVAWVWLSLACGIVALALSVWYVIDFHRTREQ